jgi:hypothetical protein
MGFRAIVILRSSITMGQSNIKVDLAEFVEVE